MAVLGTPFGQDAFKVLLCGAGELGKEVVIELQRYGVEVVAVDRYANAPAMQVAHRCHVINMLDPVALRKVIESERPNLIVPEIEAIATSELVKLAQEGFCVVPSAKAVHLTMNREGIRRLASEELGLPTSRFQFANTMEEFVVAVKEIGVPCVVKPIMSSSGKGQSIVKDLNQMEAAWLYAQEGGRAGAGKVIVEGFVDFDYEITLLTVRHRSGVSFCEPIGHLQVEGDYRESWQPQVMSRQALDNSKVIADKVTGALGGFGVFGVELFVKGDSVYFSEVSPRPHDTGLVTLISQNLSEFALHARAILGLAIPEIQQLGPSASSAMLVEGESDNIRYVVESDVLSESNTELRLFGKPSVKGRRRMGVGLSRAATIDEAIASAVRVRKSVRCLL